jgi:uncharacterized protein (DUF2267 family)
VIEYRGYEIETEPDGAYVIWRVMRDGAVVKEGNGHSAELAMMTAMIWIDWHEEQRAQAAEAEAQQGALWEGA